MKYRVVVKQLRDGRHHVRCHAAPLGVAETFADTREASLENMRKEIRYQLEWCPCSGIAEDLVELDILHQ